MITKRVICRSMCASSWLSHNFLPIRVGVSCAVRKMSAGAKSDQVRQEASKGSVKKKPTTILEFFNMGLPIDLRLTDDSTLVCARVIHPGIPIETYDRSRQVSLHYLLKVGSIARTFALHAPSPTDDKGRSFFEYRRLTDHHYTYFASSVLEISPALFDYTLPKHPLEFKVQGGYVGRSSIQFVSTMTSPADPERRQLVQQVNQLVLVDKETRRPVPIDEDWRRQYQPHCVRGQSLVVKKQDVPSSGPASIYEVKVAWSDTDNYNHTNFSSYGRFAMDAVYDALRLGKLNCLTREDMVFGMSRVKMTYLGECVEGDMLRVLIWPAEDAPRTVVCSMEKDGDVICQVTVSFHAPS